MSCSLVQGRERWKRKVTPKVAPAKASWILFPLLLLVYSLAAMVVVAGRGFFLLGPAIAKSIRIIRQPTLCCLAVESSSSFSASIVSVPTVAELRTLGQFTCPVSQVSLSVRQTFTDHVFRFLDLEDLERAILLDSVSRPVHDASSAPDEAK